MYLYEEKKCFFFSSSSSLLVLLLLLLFASLPSKSECYFHTSFKWDSQSVFLSLSIFFSKFFFFFDPRSYYGMFNNNNKRRDTNTHRTRRSRRSGQTSFLSLSVACRNAHSHTHTHTPHTIGQFCGTIALFSSSFIQYDFEHQSAIQYAVCISNGTPHT